MNNLKLRSLQDKDMIFMLEWMQQSDVNDFFMFDPSNITAESVLAFIRDSRV